VETENIFILSKFRAKGIFKNTLINIMQKNPLAIEKMIEKGD